MFKVIKGVEISNYLDQDTESVLKVVGETYLMHKNGSTNNPDSYFLKFPDNEKNRIIALPASINDPKAQISGIKWIASYPGNIEKNLQRASATMVLNDYQTGYPLALLEASQISAHRTAASGAMTVGALSTRGREINTVTLVGCGVLGQKTINYVVALGIDIKKLIIYDINEQYVGSFVERNNQFDKCTIASTLKEAFDSDLVILTTTSENPYIDMSDIDLKRQVILNISLRDLSPVIIENSVNVVDDIEHCLKAQTSCHLTEQKLGNRGFINAVIADVLDGSFEDDTSKPIVISPFGLGVLDLALAYQIYKYKYDDASTVDVEGFLPDMKRL
ncbi:2,3-diaminopropionate biosynthesis protein SbnB [Chromohalobacter sp. 48-RD10]|uniref:2,3-diaminopropionate biosynthesis protein SbnB n=1 Tax=Chromohalobacter sp. 48-RD10 TaxID=2994063 RepID=UPI002468B8B7|nr:2,3-diaminopropionate biosynthesis protein SbnB [Chromohalobacter sp. 48-RD10]